MSKQQEYEIIDLVVKIFQNVGIKRCIDKIDILKNYQIYFEICKVIFPQTMIQLLRFSQGPQTNAEKIQGVIDIVGKILQNDLYHISGQSISEGKLSHIKNFLHILELLSQNVHKGNRNDQQVQSAPQNTRSISDYDQQGHYTVIGIDKQFQREYDDQDGNHYDYDQDQNEEENQQQQDTRRQYQPRNSDKKQQEQQESQNEESQSQRPMNPVLDKKQSSNKKKFVKTKPKTYSQNIQNIKIQQLKPKPYVKPVHYIHKKHQPGTITLHQFIKRKQLKQQIRKKVKSNFVRKINNVIEDFEAKKLTDLKLEYNIWVRKHELKTNQKQNQIEEQNKQRMQFANELIVQRRNKLNNLRNAKHAVNVMSNLFKQQRNIWKGMKQARLQSELEDIESIIQGDDKDQQLLRQALMVGNSQQFSNKRG